MRLVVDGAQTVVKRYDVMPFGEQISAGTGWGNGRSGDVYSPASTVKWRFGGGYKDEQNGEWPGHEMGARQYNPGYGRFVTPDENLADQDVGDPLSWNLYAYARNNPLRYSDPTGRACQQNSDGSIVDDGAGRACDFSQFMTARAKMVEVAPATDRLGEDWGFRVLAEVGRLSSDGSVVEEGMKAARDWRQLLRSNPIPLLMGVVPTTRRVRMDVRKPKLETHPQRDPRSGNHNAKKSPQPADAAEVYKTAIPDPADPTGNLWWGRSSSGDIYRYKGINGTVHWNGSKSTGTSVPTHMRPYLE